MAINISQKTAVLQKRCQRYDLFLNYSGFKLEWEWEKQEKNSTAEILITDMELSTSICDVNTFDYCNHNAKLCLSKFSILV